MCTPSVGVRFPYPIVIVPEFLGERGARRAFAAGQVVTGVTGTAIARR